jgi:hypothetical protein
VAWRRSATTTAGSVAAAAPGVEETEWEEEKMVGIGRLGFLPWLPSYWVWGRQWTSGGVGIASGQVDFQVGNRPAL